MDASCADKLIPLVQTNPVLYDKSAAGYKVKNALSWQIGVEIGVNSERTVDLFLVSRFSFLGGSVTGLVYLRLGSV